VNLGIKGFPQIHVFEGNKLVYNSHMIVLFFGENTFELHEKITRWKNAFIEKHGEFNIDEMEGSNEFSSILDAANSLPFGAEKRMVIVKNFLSSQKPEHLKKMASALPELPESSILIFWESKSPDKRTTLFKTLEKTARLEECKPKQGKELLDWIIEKIQSYGGSIDTVTANRMSALMGNDLWKLNTEIQKLIQYADDKKITPQNIETLGQGSSITSSIFKLTDALGQKKTKEALSILHQLIDQGEELPMIFAMMARQFRLIIEVRELQNKGLSNQAISQKIKQHPYAVSSIAPQCKNFKQEELKEIYKKLLEMDRGLKTGELRYQPSDQIEYLIQMEKLIIEIGSKP